MNRENDPQLEKQLLEAYSSHARNLRTWLVAYGIGAPVLFLSNESLWIAVSKAECATCIAVLFLTGVASQIFIAFVNKNAMWICYYGERTESFKSRVIYKISDWLSAQFWIDILCDIISMICFIIATYTVFVAIVR